MSGNAFTRNLGQVPTQMEQARADQVVNNAGGFVFEVSPQARLERFLILGTDGGTYYVNEKKLTKDNVDFLIKLIESDEEMVMNTVAEISLSGRAYRNSAAIFAVAALFCYGKTKSSALLSSVCRTATHLFEFAQYIELLGGWGRGKRKAVADWYRNRYESGQLAYQVVKYRQRNGWTHQDMFRLAHPVGHEDEWKAIASFILGKEHNDEFMPDTIKRFKIAQEARSVSEAMTMAPGLPWEAYPTSFHKDVRFWKQLFYDRQLLGQALLRNVVRLAKLDAFNDMVFARDYANALVDGDMIAKTRLHPIQYLLAAVTYADGQLDRERSDWYQSIRKIDWVAVPAIRQALEEGFYKAFNEATPANKRTMLALDVSGSMQQPALGIDLTCAQVSAAMAMTFMRLEPYTLTMGFSNEFRDLGLAPNMALNDVMTRLTGLTFGTTDCAQPMLYAAKNNIEVDTFVVMTDSETWSGHIHPFQALKTYRQKTGIDAKLVVVGLASTGFTIADPSDRGMLDVVGADANLPKLVTEFSAGRV